MASAQDKDDEMARFSAELQWCIHQLQLGLQKQSPDSKQENSEVRAFCQQKLSFVTTNPQKKKLPPKTAYQKLREKARMQRSINADQSIQRFYTSPAVARILPHRRFATKRGPGYVMMTTLRNSCRLYRKSSTGKVGFSKFASLRPRHVRRLGTVPADTYLCVTCTSVKIKIDALNRLLGPGEKLLPDSKLLKFLLCPFKGQWRKMDCVNAADTVRILKILQSHKAPMIKKRQAMRNALGDYRKKMKEEEKKSISGMRHSKFLATPPSKIMKNSRFLRHSNRHTAVGTKESNSSKRTDLSAEINDLQIKDTSLNANSSTLPSKVINSNLEADATDTNACATTSEVNTLQSLNDCSASISSSNKDQPSASKETFHFVPSDNAFSFQFETPAEEEITTELAEAGLEQSDNGKTSAGSQNFFKLEKSNNDFAFNFGDDE